MILCKYQVNNEIVLMIEVVRTSETSVYFNESTLGCIQERYHLHIHRRENLESHIN
jgi:hypothetical protein